MTLVHILEMQLAEFMRNNYLAKTYSKIFDK